MLTGFESKRVEVLSRSERKSIAAETLKIIKDGYYFNSAGIAKNIVSLLRDSVDETVLYRPCSFEVIDARVSEMLNKPATAVSRYEVTVESSIEAVQRLCETSQSVLCLNFASAKNPGGGFLSGSEAQEESLFRSSGLYVSLMTAKEMYSYNRLQSGLYSDYMIYSPNVPVFRDKKGELLESPYICSFLSAPAVNQTALKKSDKKRSSSVMESRLLKVLSIALERGYKNLILGAWGCGVFKNEPKMVADMFSRALLSGAFENRFDLVVFAMNSSNKMYFGPFVNNFK